MCIIAKNPFLMFAFAKKKDSQNPVGPLVCVYGATQGPVTPLVFQTQGLSFTSEAYKAKIQAP